jgi:hypothetical protein
LGIQRDTEGRITNADNEKGGYISAPEKATPKIPEKSSGDKMLGDEAGLLKEKNRECRARLRKWLRIETHVYDTTRGVFVDEFDEDLQEIVWNPLSLSSQGM